MKVAEYHKKACRVISHSFRTSALCYLGWAGGGNLGDDASFTAAQMALAPQKPLPYVPGRKEVGFLRLISFGRQAPFRALCLGGGTLIGRPEYRESLAAFLKWMKRDILVFSFGTGVMDPSFWEEHCGKKLELAAWRDLLERFDYLGVRGINSARTLAALGIKNAAVIGDPCLLYSHGEYSFREKEKIIGINLGYVKDGLLWGKKQERLWETVSRFLMVLSGKGWKVRFFGVTAEDETVHEWIARRLGQSAVMDSRVYSVPEVFMREVSRCELFLGLKLHSVILAYAAYVPVINLEYRSKCRDFMDTAGIPEYALRTDEADAGKLLEKADKACAERARLERDSFERCAYYRGRFTAYMEGIRNELALRA